jgi:hypothetical protein
MAEEKKNVPMAAIVVAAVAVAGFAAWRLTKGKPPAPDAPAWSPAAASAAPPSESGSANPEPMSSGRLKPPSPQIYPTAISSIQKIGMPLRPMDLDIFAMIEKGDVANPQDAFPSQPYRVSIMRDHLSGYVVLVTIDLDRNGRIDERWKLTPDAVERHTSPGPNGTFTDDFALRGGKWLPH